MHSAVLPSAICPFCQRDHCLFCCTRSLQQCAFDIEPLFRVNRQTLIGSDYSRLSFCYAGVETGASASTSTGTRFVSGRRWCYNTKMSIHLSGWSCFPWGINKYYFYIQQTPEFLQTVAIMLRWNYHVTCKNLVVRTSSISYTQLASYPS